MEQSKFKVGDRVEDTQFGKGIIKFNEGTKWMPYVVEFDLPTFIQNRPHCKENHGAWCNQDNLTLITDQPCEP